MLLLSFSLNYGTDEHVFRVTVSNVTQLCCSFLYNEACGFTNLMYLILFVFSGQSFSSSGPVRRAGVSAHIKTYHRELLCASKFHFLLLLYFYQIKCL